MSYGELDQALREKCRQYSKNFHEFGLEQADIMNQVYAKQEGLINDNQVQTKWAEFLVHFMDSNVPVGGEREILSKNDKKNDLNHNQAQVDDDQFFLCKFSWK